MPLQLESLVFEVNTEKLKLAKDSIDALAASMSNLNKVQQDESKSAIAAEKIKQQQAETTEANAKATIAKTKAKEAEEKATKSSTESTKANTSVLERQQSILDFMTQGYSKGQASVLAYAKATNAASSDIEELGKVLDVQRKLMGSSPFDKSMSGLVALKNQYGEVREAIRQYNSSSDLTASQTRELARDKERIIEKLKQEGAGLSQIKQSIREYNAAYVDQANKVNALSKVEKDRERSMRETANAARNVQSAEERLFSTVSHLNGQMSANVGLNERAALALGSYERNLRLAGISGEEAAKKLQKFKAAQEQLSAAEAKNRAAYVSRGIGVQAGDVFVSLASGMNPLTVAIQQGDQIRGLIQQSGLEAAQMAGIMKQAFGSIITSFKDVGVAMGSFVLGGLQTMGKSVVDVAAKYSGLTAVTNAYIQRQIAAGHSTESLATQTRLLTIANNAAAFAVGGLITVLGLVAVAMYNAAKANDALLVTVTTSGAALGLSSKELASFAEANNIAGVSSNTLKAALGGLASEGFKYKESLSTITEAAQKYALATGKDLNEVMKEYAKVVKEPVKSLSDLAVASGYVEVAVIKKVKALQDAGQSAEAAKVAIDAYADAQIKAAKDIESSLSPLAKSLNVVKNIASDVWDSISAFANSKFITGAIDKITLAFYSLVAIMGSGIIYAGAFIDVFKNPLNAGKFLEDANKRFDSFISKIRERLSDAEKLASGLTDGERKANSDAADQLAKYNAYFSKFAKEKESIEAKSISRQEYINKALREARRESGAIILQTKDYQAVIKAAGDEWDKANKKKKENNSLENKTQSFYLQTLEKINDLNVKNTVSTENLTKAEQLRQDLITSYKWDSKLGKQINLWDQLTQSEKDNINVKIEQAKAIELNTLRYKEQEKALDTLYKLQEKFNTESIKRNTEIGKVSKEIAFQYSLLGKSNTEIKQMTREYNLQSKSSAVIAKYEELRRQEAEKYNKEIEKVSDPIARLALEKEHLNNLLDLNIQNEEELTNVRKQYNLEVLQDYQQQWYEIRDGISNSIYVALTEGGEEGAKAIRKLIEEQLKKRFIMPAIDVVVNFIAGGVTKLAGGVVGAIAGALGVSSGSWLGELVGLAGGGAGLALVNKVIGNTSGGSSGSKIVDAIADAIPTGNQYGSLVAGYNLTSEATVSAIASYSDAAIKMGEESVKYIKEASELMASTLPDVVEQGKQLMEKGVEMAEKAASYRTTSEYLSKGNNLAANGFMKTAFNAIAETKFGAALGFSKEISKGVYELTEIGASWGDGLKQVGGFVEKAAPYFDAIIKLAQGDVKDAAISAAVTYALSQIGTTYVPYAGAIMKLLDGQVKEAAATAALTYVGSLFGPIGSAIGAVLGSFIKFGGGEIYKKAIISASSVYKEDGTSSFTPIELLRVDQMGFKATEGLLAEYNRRAAAMLKAFDIDPTGLQSTLGMRQRRSSHTTVASFGVNKEGEGLPLSNYMSLFYGTRGNPLTAFEDFARDILGQGLKLAINAFDVPGNIKKLFEGISTNDAMDAAFRKILELDAILTLFGSGLREFIGDIDFAALAKEGEVGFDIVGRVLQEVLGLNAVFQTLNFTLFELTANGVRGTLLFKELLGGAEEYEKYLNEYYNNFFSQAEKRANTIKSIENQLQMAGADISKMNLGEMTRMQYRELLEGTIAVKGATDPLAIALIKLSSTFASVTEEIISTSKELEEEAKKKAIEGAWSNLSISLDNLKRAINAEKEAIAARTKASIDNIKLLIKSNEAEKVQVNNRISEFKRLMDSISSAISKLRSVANQEMQLAQARKFIDNALTQAKSGIFPDADKLSDVLNVLTSDSANAYASIAEFEYAQLVQAGKLDELNLEIGKQKTIAEMQLEVLEQANLHYEKQIKLLEEDAARQNAILDNILNEAQRQIDVLKGIDTSVLSVRDAVAGMNAAIGDLAAVLKKPAPAPISYPSSGSGITSIASIVSNGSYVPTAGSSMYFPGGATSSTGSGSQTQPRTQTSTVTETAPSTTVNTSDLTAAEKVYLELYIKGNPSYYSDPTNLQSAVDYIKGLDDYQALASASGYAGVEVYRGVDGYRTIRELEAAFGVSVSDPQYQEGLQAYDQGMRYYADGGSYPGGLALVGEEGPELINFSNPGMVYTAAQTSNLLGNTSDEAVVQAIARLEARLVNIEKNTRDQKETLFSVTEGGNAMRTQAI